MMCDSFDDELQDILDWFEENYLGSVARTGRARDPLFPPEMWNVYQRTLLGQHRTNNYAEAANRMLQHTLDADHPSIWAFIDGIKRLQRQLDAEYEMMVRGNEAPQKRRKYRDADRRLLTLAQSFHERPLLEYLRGVAHNFYFD